MINDDLAATARFAGSYKMSGGSVLRLAPQGAFLRVEGALDGLAMSFAGRLVIAFGPKDKMEIGAYRVGKNQMEGLWVPPAADDLIKCGREQSGGGKDGVWTITKAIAIDNTEYTGSVIVKPVQGADAAHRPTPVELEWRLHDGNYRSFGLVYDDAMYTTFSFEPDKPHGIILFEARGDRFEGTLMRNDLSRGSETMTPQP